MDVGSAHDVSLGIPEGCKGKIDVLFVMSGSGLLVDVQPQLVAAFPKFIETISTKFKGFDYHIMVTDGDPGWGLPHCDTVCPELLTCMRWDPCCPYINGPKELPCCGVPDYPCDMLDSVSECDRTLGAGSVFPAGDLAANKPCKIDKGRRYLTQDQTNLSETFSCIAQVGVSGSEMVAAALVNAISPKFNAPGGCNEGFLRDDALLMVIMVTDGSDFKSPGLPDEWYEAVIAAKGGDSESIVLLRIGKLPYPDCYPKDALCQFSTQFPYVVTVSNTVGDYPAVFDEATDLFGIACESLIPQ